MKSVLEKLIGGIIGLAIMLALVIVGAGIFVLDLVVAGIVYIAWVSFFSPEAQKSKNKVALKKSAKPKLSQKELSRKWDQEREKRYPKLIEDANSKK